MRQIVLTGGPGSGKTTVCARLAGAAPQRFVVVPEAATQVYTMLNTRWGRLDVEGRRDLQRGLHGRGARATIEHHGFFSWLPYRNWPGLNLPRAVHRVAWPR